MIFERLTIINQRKYVFILLLRISYPFTLSALLTGFFKSQIPSKTKRSSFIINWKIQIFDSSYQDHISTSIFQFILDILRLHIKYLYFWPKLRKIENFIPNWDIGNFWEICYQDYINVSFHTNTHNFRLHSVPLEIFLKASLAIAKDHKVSFRSKKLLFLRICSQNYIEEV